MCIVERHGRCIIVNDLYLTDFRFVSWFSDIYDPYKSAVNVIPFLNSSHHHKVNFINYMLNSTNV